MDTVGSESNSDTDTSMENYDDDTATDIFSLLLNRTVPDEDPNSIEEDSVDDPDYTVDQDTVLQNVAIHSDSNMADSFPRRRRCYTNANRRILAGSDEGGDSSGTQTAPRPTPAAVGSSRRKKSRPVKRKVPKQTPMKSKNKTRVTKICKPLAPKKIHLDHFITLSKEELRCNINDCKYKCGFMLKDEDMLPAFTIGEIEIELTEHRGVELDHNSPDSIFNLFKHCKHQFNIHWSEIPTRSLLSMKWEKILTNEEVGCLPKSSLPKVERKDQCRELIYIQDIHYGCNFSVLHNVPPQILHGKLCKKGETNCVLK